MTDKDLDLLHKQSIRNKAKLFRSKQCGCFYCSAIFTAKDIKSWVPGEEDTARCPYCGIDSVIGDACGVAVTTELLDRMYERWF